MCASIPKHPTSRTWSTLRSDSHGGRRWPFLVNTTQCTVLVKTPTFVSPPHEHVLFSFSLLSFYPCHCIIALNMGFMTVYPIIIAACLFSLVQPYAITGLKGGVNQISGQRPFRQDFSTFKNSGAAFDLYILALQQLQQQNQSTLLSYYQVAGDISQ